MPPDSPAGLCPDCLFGVGLAGDDARPAADGQSADGQPADGQNVDSAVAATISPSPPGAFVPPSPGLLAPLFPQLEVIELIGVGGMGAVYKARQKNLDRLVAVKIIRPEAAQDPAFAERFMREARTLALLNHANIVGVYDFGEVEMDSAAVAGAADSQPTGILYYFIMEYVDGLNLRQMIEGRQLAAEQALAIVPQVCEALQFAHDQGVVHRDIKPENILLDVHGRVKIADFGLAKLAARRPQDFTLTAANQVMGTPRYMAPEQMTGAHDVDHRADIYSLGVVFYEMLTGELPLGRFQPPSASGGVDARLDQVVMKTLQREPEARYQNAIDVKTDVELVSQTPRADEPPPVATLPASDSPGSPAPAYAPTVAVNLDHAHDTVKGPARALIALGVLNIVLPMVMAAIFVPLALTRILPSDAAPLGAVFCLPALPLGIFILLAGLSMRRLGSYDMSLIGTVCAMIPLSPAIVFSLPLGIWAWLVLRKPEVRAAFAQRPKGWTPTPAKPASAGDVETATRLARAPAIGLIVVGLLNLLPGVVLLGMSGYEFVEDVVRIQSVAPSAASGALALARPPVLLAAANVTRSRPPSRRAGEYLTIGTFALLLHLPTLVLLVLGGWKMQQLQQRGLVMTAAIVATLPVHAAFVVGLPIGIWALVVLAAPKVKAAFVARQYESPGSSLSRFSPPQPDEPRAPAIYKLLAIAGYIAGMLAMLYGVIMMIYAHKHVQQWADADRYGNWFVSGIACLVAGGALVLGASQVRRWIYRIQPPQTSSWNWEDGGILVYTLLGCGLLLVAPLLPANQIVTELVFWAGGGMVMGTGVLFMLSRFAERMVARLRQSIKAKAPQQIGHSYLTSNRRLIVGVVLLLLVVASLAAFVFLLTLQPAQFERRLYYRVGWENRVKANSKEIGELMGIVNRRMTHPNGTRYGRAVYKGDDLAGTPFDDLSDALMEVTVYGVDGRMDPAFVKRVEQRLAARGTFELRVLACSQLDKELVEHARAEESVHVHFNGQDARWVPVHLSSITAVEGSQGVATRKDGDGKLSALILTDDLHLNERSIERAEPVVIGPLSRSPITAIGLWLSAPAKVDLQRFKTKNSPDGEASFWRGGRHSDQRLTVAVLDGELFGTNIVTGLENRPPRTGEADLSLAMNLNIAEIRKWAAILNAGPLPVKLRPIRLGEAGLDTQTSNN